jgi:hypothetical protein
MMHKLSIAFACAAGVFAGQACQADSGAQLYLARANTSAEQFQQDRDDCIAKATKHVRVISQTSSDYAMQPGMGDPAPTVWSLPTTEVSSYEQHSNPVLIRCMLAKGYQISPTGPQTSR